MLRTVYWYIHFAVTLLLRTADLFRLKKQRDTMPEKEFNTIVEALSAKWARAQINASGAQLTLNGLENIPPDEPALFVSNHQSNFDIAFFLAYVRVPKGYIAKSETLKLPLLRTWMQYLNCLFIDRKDIRQAAQMISKGTDLLRNGYSLVVFPEGTRSKSGVIGDFRGGSFKLATKSKAKIIPVTIDGSYRLMEANNNRIVPATVMMTIHPPIDTALLSKEALAALPETVKAIIASVL